MPRLVALSRAFLAGRSGSISIVFGLMLLPLLTVIGIAIDHGRVSRMHTTLQSAADNAAESVLTKLHLPPSELQPLLRANLDANLPEEFRGLAFTHMADKDAGTIEIEVAARMETPMLGLIGSRQADIAVKGRARISKQEIAAGRINERIGQGQTSAPKVDPEAVRRATEALSRLTGGVVMPPVETARQPDPEQLREAERALAEFARRLQVR